LASTTTRPPAASPSRPEKPDAAETPSVEPYRLTPKLARRVALLGGVLVIGFAALLGRLWALQVLAGSHYAAKAQANQLRTVRVAAPRGPIVDRNGNVLVANKPVTAVELWPSGLPKSYARRVSELRALTHITGAGLRQISRLIVERRQKGDMLDPVVVRPATPGPMLTYLEERAGNFPGVTLARRYIRRYPHGSLAAQLLGYVGQNTQSAGDVIGQTGIEYSFDKYLRGVAGAARVRVDSLGRPQSQPTLAVQPQPGQTVRCSVEGIGSLVNRAVKET